MPKGVTAYDPSGPPQLGARSRGRYCCNTVDAQIEERNKRIELLERALPEADTTYQEPGVPSGLVAGTKPITVPRRYTGKWPIDVISVEGLPDGSCTVCRRHTACYTCGCRNNMCEAYILTDTSQCLDCVELNALFGGGPINDYGAAQSRICARSPDVEDRHAKRQAVPSSSITVAEPREGAAKRNLSENSEGQGAGSTRPVQKSRREGGDEINPNEHRSAQGATPGP